MCSTYKRRSFPTRSSPVRDDVLDKMDSERAELRVHTSVRCRRK